MPRPRQTHYLPANHKVWTPPHVIMLDSETRTVPDTEPELLTLRLWVARLIDRQETKGGKKQTLEHWGHTAEELGTQIEGWIKGRTTLWVYCHNLSFDITTTRLPLVLVSLGWTVTEAAVSGSAPWLRLKRGSAHLTLVDSGSWLSVPLEDVGRRLGMNKPVLPTDNDCEDTWLARCRADVDILATAMLTLMAWWDTNELGRWTVSGAGSGWNAMRHMPTPCRVVINTDADQIAADRAAVHGGRRGLWAVGTRTKGPFIDLDFRNAYPTVAAWESLPSRRSTAFDTLELDDWRLTNDRWGIIAEVELETETPRWPVRVAGATWLPTGRFLATLAGPEIRDALRLGALRSIRSGHVHQLAPHMLTWGQWVLDLINARPTDVPPIVQLAAKNWSRSVIGKWASREYSRLELGPSPYAGWHYEEGLDHDDSGRGAMIDMGGQRWWSWASGDSEQAYPAVLAWIESETRMRLTRTIEAVGEGCVLQCDTDGLIVNESVLGTKAARGHLVAPAGLNGPARTKWIIDNLDPIIAPLTIRVKASHKTVRLLGPQHYRLGTERTYSGLPGMAEEVKPDTFTYRSWPKLQWQMENGTAAGYTRPQATVTVRGPYAPGWVTSMGSVVPPEATIGRDGASRLLSWDAMTRKPARARLAPVQHPILEALW